MTELATFVVLLAQSASWMMVIVTVAMALRRSRQGGHEVVAASPKSGINTITGEGLKEAMAGAQVVIDLANSPSFEDKAVLEFFETSGRNLLAAEAAAGVRHHVALSIVGNRPENRQGLFPRQGRPRETDRDLRHPLHHHPLDPVPGIPRRHRRFKFGWKHSQDFARPVPAHRGGRRCCHRCRCGARDAAKRIVEIAGPERAPFNEIVARYLKAVGDPREVVSDPEAQYFGGRVEEHSLVPLGEARLGRIGFDEWLRRSQAAA